MSETSNEEAPARPQPAAPFEIHPLRDAVVAEVHARPFVPLETPRVLHSLTFFSSSVTADVEALARFCRAHGIAEPAPTARHHRIVLGAAELRWESHTEFVTMTLAVAPPAHDPFAAPNLASLAAFLPKPSGPLIVATRLALIACGDGLPALDMFDAASLSASQIDGGDAVIATDFRPDSSGFTRILVANRSLQPSRCGALAQRLIEIETYRTMALLGLPEAQRIGPIVGRIEGELSDLTARMREPGSLGLSRELLDRLVALAAEVEAESSSAAYRFGATRAYSELVSQRLAAIGEERLPDHGPIDSFLARRMKPALRTCEAVSRRLNELADKLARTANLLRTRVDIELESQNRDLLDSMNRRSRQQLRLQRTVEGLSVAAISYYLVGLFGYLAKAGDPFLGPSFDPVLATAVAVPVAVLFVWLVVRRIRRSHADD